MNSLRRSILPLMLGCMLPWGGAGAQTNDADRVAAEPTPIQLKVMQERKFLKPYEDLLDAIKTSVGYSSGECVIVREPSINARGRQVKGQVNCHYRPKVAETRTSNPFLAFIPFIGAVAQVADAAQTMADVQKAAEDARKQISKIDFELSFPRKDGKYKDDETIVRMVMFQGQVNPAVVKIADIYAENFKKIADALFIEALAIPPAEQE